jgi:hypothetical protein
MGEITTIKAWPKGKFTGYIRDIFDVLHRVTLTDYWLIDSDNFFHTTTPTAAELIVTGGDFDLVQVEVVEMLAGFGGTRMRFQGKEIAVASESIIRFPMDAAA